MVDDADGGGTGGVSRYRFRQAVPVEPEHLLAARGRPGTVIASGRLAATHNRPASGLHCRCSSREWQGGVRGRIVRAYVGRVHRAVPGRVDSSADGFAHSADCCPSLAVLLLSAACYLIPHIIVPARSWAHPFRGCSRQVTAGPSCCSAAVSQCGRLLCGCGGCCGLWRPDWQSHRAPCTRPIWPRSQWHSSRSLWPTWPVSGRFAGSAGTRVQVLPRPLLWWPRIPLYATRSPTMPAIRNGTWRSSGSRTTLSLASGVCRMHSSRLSCSLGPD